MEDRLTEEEAETLLKALNEIVETGPWAKSNFLRIIGKNITQIRDDVAEAIGAIANADANANQDAQLGVAKADQTTVYISLYSSNGSDMTTWERIVANLPKQMISRPIYADETDAKNAIKHKENQVNEAYLVAYIYKTDILELVADKIAYDKLGKPLLSLKDRCLRLDNISHFVHYSGTYGYDRGHLVKK